MDNVASDVAEVVEAYATADRGHADDSPWVMLNMITSIDGAIAIDGVSGALGGPADKAVFGTVRGVADVIVVAAGTAIAENYGPPLVRPDMAARRAAAGQAERPAIAVVTRSLRLDPEARLFTTPGFRPVVVTVEDAPIAARRRLAAVADIVDAGIGDVDLRAAVRLLAERFGTTVLVEGGPTLNGLFAEADLFDELCISTGALLVGGPSGRMLGGDRDHEPRRFGIDQVHAAGGMTFSRWLRAR